jgi:hypothetical protein
MKLIDRIITRKFTIQQWFILKWITWIVLNAYLWYRTFNIFDAIVINVLVFVIYGCTRVHSVAMGMIVAQMHNDNEEQLPPYFYVPIDKNDIN